jgi:16S rRNA (adenine1518-N6/adenine1519-N6)-dimethyltransferase
MLYPPKQILEKYGIKAKKKLGQHFLINPLTSQQIVEQAEIETDDIVIEIGAGLGALTIPLAKRVKKLIAIEYDRIFIPILKEVLETNYLKNIEILSYDALKCNYKKVADLYQQKIKIIGNLPYNISSSLLFLFLEERETISNMTLMLQEEVSQRLLAKCGSKTYGLLSILYALVAEIAPIMRLAPESFYPRPKVFSQVIKINWRAKKIIWENDFITFLKTVFSRRRKTILNALKGCGIKIEDIKKILSSLGINTKNRPEQITPNQYLNIYQRVSCL